jgi:hypothetical protein
MLGLGRLEVEDTEECYEVHETNYTVKREERGGGVQR